MMHCGMFQIEQLLKNKLLYILRFKWFFRVKYIEKIKRKLQDSIEDKTRNKPKRQAFEEVTIFHKIVQLS